MVSASGGRTPIWDWRGELLYFMNADRQLIAADLSSRGKKPFVRSLRTVENTQLADTGVIAGYDAVNGRILGLLPGEGGAHPELIMLTDFRVRLAPLSHANAP
jgi:hypothetical protein